MPNAQAQEAAIALLTGEVYTARTLAALNGQTLAQNLIIEKLDKDIEGVSSLGAATTATGAYAADSAFRGKGRTSPRSRFRMAPCLWDVVPSVLLSFQGTAPNFSTSGVPIDRDSFVAEAGLDYAITPAIKVGVSYSGQFGQRAMDNTFKGRFDWSF